LEYPQKVSTSVQKIAKAFEWLETPPSQLAGELVTKKVHLPFSLQVLDNFSRSNISPSGIPHRAKIYSCNMYFSRLGQASKDGASPATAAK
jgi:hypothetical protein